MLYVTILVLHTAISFTAARWWMRPTLLWFDRRYQLPPCRESDFYFFCFMWSVVLVMVAVYAVWKAFLGHVLHPVYRAVLPSRIRAKHLDEDTGHPVRGPLQK